MNVIWTIEKAVHQRTEAFELWCWRRLLRVPWTARRSNQSSERKSTLNWWWSWSSNTLAIWCKQPIHWKRPWCWERLRVRGEKGDRGWDGWMASSTRWTWVWVDSEFIMDREAWYAAVHGITKSCTQFSNCTSSQVMLLLVPRSHFGNHSSKT